MVGMTDPRVGTYCFTHTIAGEQIEQHRAYRSRTTVWRTPDRRVSIHHMNRDGSLTVFVDDKLLPRSYKTLEGAVRAAMEAKEQRQ